MRTIPVEPWNQARAFPTFTAAIRNAMSHPALQRLASDEDRLRGATIIDGFWTDAEFVIRFDLGLHLRIFVAPTTESSAAVTWELLDAHAIPDSEVGRVGSSAVRLEFPRIGRVVMDRSLLLARRRGQPLRRLFVSDMGFFVYTPGKLILQFQCVRRRDTGETLLYVSEDT